MKRYINILVILISVATVFSGITQLVAPQFVLGFIGANITDTTSHFFAIIGMFMALFGGLMLHAVYSVKTPRSAVLWSAFQKLGAFVAVGLGVLNEIFLPIALGVALFDLFSGVLFLYYLKNISK